RQVAATAEPRRDLTPAPGGDRDPGADAVAIGGGSLEGEGQEVAGGGSRLVVEQGQRGALGDDQDVDAAVVVDVADGQSAAKSEDRPGISGLFRDIAEAARRVAEQELGAHLVGE